MEINNIEIKRGESKTINLNISSLPSGTPISLSVNIFRSHKKGPTILLSAGVHGDEINGIEIIRRATELRLFDELQCGTIITIPLVNLYGFINFSRDLPDGKDVNRSFPGSKNGSLAARIANSLTENILPLIDYGIDFHTGGASIYNAPQLRVYREDSESINLAKMFSSPIVLKTGLITKSLRKECYKKNIPMIVFEGGESLRLDNKSIDEGIAGIRRVLSRFKMISQVTKNHNIQIFEQHKWIRANASGIFVSKIQSGEFVKKGDEIGYISDPYSSKKTLIIAKQDALIIGHDNKPVVNIGKALFHLAY